MTERELVIGIDVGTTRVKAGVFRQDGEILDYFSEAYSTHHDGVGIVEQNPLDWSRLVSSALDSFAKHADQVAAIGLCSQVNTHAFVDHDIKPLTQAIVWQDTRAANEAARLDTSVSNEERVRWWGAPMPIDASHALSRMQWMADHEPELWQQTRYVMLPKDFCIAHLTGKPVTDGLSNIGLTGADLSYADEALALVSGAHDRMAPLADVVSIVGEVQNGPFKGIPVANCTMDAWTGILGTTGAGVGVTGYLSGTSEILGINAPTVNPTPGIIVFANCNGVRLHAGPTQAGGASLTWLCTLLDKSATEIMELAANAEETTPLFLPHIQGERAPIWNPSLRGVFAGLDQTCGPAELARSVLEGVAYSVRHLLDALEQSTGSITDTIVGGGGGFQSDVWNQIRADVLGCRVVRVTAKDPGVLGAAGIAACAIGLSDNLHAAFGDLQQTDAEYEPDPNMHQRHLDRFELYKQTIEANAPINAALIAGS